MSDLHCSLLCVARCRRRPGKVARTKAATKKGTLLGFSSNTSAMYGKRPYIPAADEDHARQVKKMPTAQNGEWSSTSILQKASRDTQALGCFLSSFHLMQCMQL